MARGFDPDSAFDVAKLQAQRALSWLQGPGLRAATAVTLAAVHQEAPQLAACAGGYLDRHSAMG
ncbi:hypothetical protein ISF_05210 [Cordyceps fumosorosea ARSEF 2679]|uniref:Uncharacterized protein n=1 Tax=Cordyceps fumosorosea (strain ARSEF 2679) TaxID=1081104 RepID=A0A167V3Z9_CORFA|nr:hypothetical protein ISF_05210 [Cordyceps fumosorosea ARSEF 2679]OAA62201.1 hypothetical protein ISF_05210 [Cordyceps fumosorosea ARSEF 2679]